MVSNREENREVKGQAALRSSRKDSRRRLAPWLYAALGLLYLLHNDLWLWGDSRLVLGLPAGLTYHLGYCLAAALLFAALVRWAWPGHLADEEDPPEAGPRLGDEGGRR